MIIGSVLVSVSPNWLLTLRVIIKVPQEKYEKLGLVNVELIPGKTPKFHSYDRVPIPVELFWNCIVSGLQKTPELTVLKSATTWAVDPEKDINPKTIIIYEM